LDEFANHGLNETWFCKIKVGEGGFIFSKHALYVCAKKSDLDTVGAARFRNYPTTGDICGMSLCRKR
jgi:hypothetical protein